MVREAGEARELPRQQFSLIETSLAPFRAVHRNSGDGVEIPIASCNPGLEEETGQRPRQKVVPGKLERLDQNIQALIVGTPGIDPFETPDPVPAWNAGEIDSRFSGGQGNCAAVALPAVEARQIPPAVAAAGFGPFPPGKLVAADDAGGGQNDSGRLAS